MKDFRHLHIVNCDDREKAVAHILEEWQGRDAHCVVNYMYYANFVRLHHDQNFFDSMKMSDFILMDGIGMQLYMGMVKGIWPYNLNGTDLNPVFVKRLDERKIPIAFYGTTKESIYQAVKNVSTYLRNRSICYSQDGYSPLNWSRIADKSALMIGMGSPLQENWVADHIGIIREKKLLVITVGGFFDFASGVYIRAPKRIRKMKLEWAWRTMLHPRRHMKKRIRDLSILYKPLYDRIRGFGKFINLRSPE
jgi:exopolysaccharide biosynthesis WecB/TagA/CpsF family protein